ncbi:MAG: hypothetical protein DLM58_09480 [Pseudonocardiales bacterium]|nr:MAG: hypothetical protein DLM58_09480 [Pseudonocardiales bacterium]
MTPTNFSASLWTSRNSPWRWLLACAATVSAVAHLPVISAHLAKAPYMGEEFIVLTAACLLVALAAIICDSAAVYSLGLLTCGLAIAGYLATRLIAFPQLAADVGNWFEPLGVVSVLAESLAVVAAISALRARSVGQLSTGQERTPWPPPRAVPPASTQLPALPGTETEAASESAPSWPVWATPVG